MARARKQANIRQRGKSWVVHFRVDGRQVWRSFKTRDEAELFLAQARAELIRGEYRQPVRVTFAEAAAEWLEHGEHVRKLKHSTMVDYRSAVARHLIPAFGRLQLEAITAGMVERWRSQGMAAGTLPPRTANKLLAIMHAIFERARKAYAFPTNPLDDVERHPERYSGDLDFYSPEELWALVRAAVGEQDAAIFLTAAFTGLRRGELVALRWRDVDFAGSALRVRASVSLGVESAPKSGKVRTVPMVPDVAEALARLASRAEPAADDTLVFPGVDGGYLDASALRRRYVAAVKRAGLRPIRFHDLRHTFGSLAINRASIVQVQSWLGHADVKTTMRYLHHKSRVDDAAQLAEAFRVAASPATKLLEEAAVLAGQAASSH